LAKSVHDAGWSAFVGMLQYKAALHGRTFAKVDRAFPSFRRTPNRRRRTGGDAKRLWSAGKTGTRARTAR
ncbi:zinc ribbon domain-containing protein, partial [Streptomyces sp. NRRL S-813]|uniref:zinc ribbon domain-containing protein n=1 Tax=Streptomyces sp. NRRL S-813 TaxID=1463919 RepID=UPI003B640761